MKKRYKSILLILLLITLQCSVSGQVHISFQPTIHGRSLDGITFFQVNNQSNNEFKANIRIVVTEERSGKVVEVNAFSFFLRKGINSFNRSILGNAKIVFAANNIGNILRQSGKLPEGEYEYCYELSPTEEKPGLLDSYENCFQLNLQPLTPLLLLDPVDEDKSCNRKPNFRWQPPMPVDFNARYHVVLVELKEKQTTAEALSFNLPLINIRELREPRANYPTAVKELEEDKTYVWQVAYSVNNILLSKSEIWSFKIDCEEARENKTDDSYRELKSASEGDFYVANGAIKFAVNNDYGAGDLVYNIVNLKEGREPIRALPKLKLLPGLNKYEIKLSDYRAFVNGEHYQLEVKLLNGQKLYLRFTYRD